MDNIKISLAAARVNKGFTQKDVADKLGVSIQSVCSWEKEPHKINICTAYQLADLYDLRIDNLIFVQI